MEAGICVEVGGKEKGVEVGLDVRICVPVVLEAGYVWSRV